MLKRLNGVPITLMILLLLVFLAGCSGNNATSTGNAENSGASAKSNETITIKMSTIQGPNAQGGRVAERFAELVKERLGDKVKVEVFPNAQLYSMTEEVNALMRNDVQMVAAVGPSLEGVHPNSKILKLPFLFDNFEQAYKILDGEIGSAIFEGLDKKNIEIRATYTAGPYFVSNNKRPLETLEDFQGLKIISQGISQSVGTDQLGAQSVNIPNEDQLAALQQGLADGVGTPSSVFTARRFETVQKYLTDVGTMWFSYSFILSNKSFWDGLPDDIRTELDSIVEQVEQEERENVGKSTASIIAKIEEAGIQVSELDSNEAKRIKSTLQGAYDTIIRGEKMEDIAGKVLKQLK